MEVPGVDDPESLAGEVAAAHHDDPGWLDAFSAAHDR